MKLDLPPIFPDYVVSCDYDTTRNFEMLHYAAVPIKLYILTDSLQNSLFQLIKFSIKLKV